MHWISQLLAGLTALLFLYIMVLETFATASAVTARTFRMSQEALRSPQLNTVMKNLGIYNGLVGVGLIYGLFASPNPCEISAVFLSFGALVAVYGACTSQPAILLKQGTLPILGLLSLVWL